VTKRRFAAFHAMQIWEAHQPFGRSSLTFDANTMGKKSLGYIIENDVIRCCLHEMLSEYSSDRFSFHEQCKVQSLAQTEKKVQVTSREGDVFSGRLLIGADGAHSKVRTLANMTVNVKPYAMDAIVATVKTKKAHDFIARQVFLTTGPLAFLPLADAHYSSIVWSLPEALATEYMQLSANDFSKCLTNAFSEALGDVSLMSQRYAFPLLKQVTPSYLADKLVLVGDAAHVVHPLAGQGINLGINDANVLSHVIETAIQHHRDIASPLTLRRYERRAKAEAMLMVKAIDGIHHFFVAENKRYVTLREGGMVALASCRFLKQRIMQMATGVVF